MGKRKSWKGKKELVDLPVPEPTRTPKRKDMLALFILFFPTVLVALMPRIPLFAFDMAVVVKTLLCFYQCVIIKNFIDDYYEKQL